MMDKQAKYQGIFDAHAHYDEACYAARLAEVLESERQQGVSYIINSGSDVASSERSVALANQFPFIFASVGVFPLAVQDRDNDWLEAISSLAADPRVLAIGEIGLDYHAGKDESAVQQDVFDRQLHLAQQLDKAVVLHIRDADEDALSLLVKHKSQGVVHRFASSPNAGKAYLELGLYLSIGPNITYPDFAHVLTTVQSMPVERLILETDAPFLPSAHLQGQLAYSHMIADVADVIARTRGDYSPQEIIDIAGQNARRLFHVPD